MSKFSHVVNVNIDRIKETTGVNTPIQVSIGDATRTTGWNVKDHDLMIGGLPAGTINVMVAGERAQRKVVVVSGRQTGKLARLAALLPQEDAMAKFSAQELEPLVQYKPGKGKKNKFSHLAAIQQARRK